MHMRETINPVGKTLWLVESALGSELTLDYLADACGMSRFSLIRVFGVVTGHTVMRYVRERRLSEAARQLVGGASSILDVALDAGYHSHEAFTRAFHDAFGLTPEALRARSSLDGLNLMEPLRMDQQQQYLELEPPRFETSKPMLIAGLGGRFSYETVGNIPELWRRFGEFIGTLPHEVMGAAYGVCVGADGEQFDYVAGVQVTSKDHLPKDFVTVAIPARRYAVFTWRGHISAIHTLCNTIWNKWLPESGERHAKAPDFEKYGQSFDPATGNGGFEIWVPVE
ncbi:AraC family transcriptional regulator [Silvimonas amylolytica]|nr:AraC family transcriptional regulator [Silvimonas amylolytica]